jgi:hypothetical protein
MSGRSIAHVAWCEAKQVNEGKCRVTLECAWNDGKTDTMLDYESHDRYSREG